MRTICRLATVPVLIACVGLSASAADLSTLIKTLQAVGPEGAGNEAAADAWQELARADARQIPEILAGLDAANPLAANWIRTAVDAIAERQLQTGGKLPAAELQRFALDTDHAPKARRLAYEWLVRVDPTAPRRLLPDMLDDPSLELRRDAVTRRIQAAGELQAAGKTKEAVAAYEEVLSAARDADQVKTLAGRLRKLDREVDLPRHFGYLTDWHVIGPFDNTDEKGFDAVYPPEGKIDLKATYPGKNGPVKWTEVAATGDFASVDLNKPLGEEKSVVGYAVTRFVSPRRQEVEVRMMSFNALKVWVNGRLVDQHNVYHAGAQMDQYVCRVTLEPGENVIRVKACQNKIMEEWARYWQFQLRVCDARGTAVLSADRD